MRVVQEYWQGALQRLEAEVDVISRLVKHHGERGRENENALIRLLEALVPQRLGTGTGMVIDNGDRYSAQTDIVLYDQALEPAVFAQTTQLLFPVENVHACVEVKTSLTADEMKDSAGKKEKLLALQPARAYPDGSRYPLFIVFAYNSAVSPNALTRQLQALPAAHRPDLLCSLRVGFLFGKSGVFADGEGSGVTVLLGEDGLPREADSSAKEASIGGRAYPIAEIGGRTVAIHPARALLLFLDRMLSLLASQQNLPPPSLSLYLDEQARRLTPA